MALAEAKTDSDQLLPSFFHALQQPHGALAVQQEIFVHDEEGAHFQIFFHAAHDVVQFVAGFKEVDELAFAAEERGGGAEVASHGAAHRRNDGGCGRSLAVGHANSHDACAHSRNNCGMADGALSHLRPGSGASTRLPSPRTMWSASIMCSTPGMAATCPPTTMVDFGERLRIMRHISRTLATFTMIEVMPTTSY